MTHTQYYKLKHNTQENEPLVNINPFQISFFISIPHENTKKQKFFDVFRRCRNETLA